MHRFAEIEPHKYGPMNPSPNHPKHQASVWSETLAVSLLLTLVCLLAWPGMKSPLLLDDLDQANHVSAFNSWRDCFGSDVYGLFRPIKNIIFYAFGNLSLFNWHALGLLLYLAAIPAVYLFLRRFLDSPLWALTVVALWATSPTQVSTAIWMSCANISLAIMFTGACLYFHDLSQAGADRYFKFTLLASLCLFLAQTSYETAISVPALCVLVDAMRRRPLFTRQAMIRYALLAIVTLIYLAVRTHFGARYTVHANSGFIPDSPGWQISLSAPWFLWMHFSMWLMPLGRIEIFGTYLWGISATPWELAAAWAWLISMIGLIVFTWRRQPWIACGLLWFLATNFPSSNFIPIRVGPIADYYLVFPGLGLAIALAGCAKSLVALCKRKPTNPESRQMLIGGSLLCVGAMWRILCIPLFWLQADLWTRPLELFVRCDLTRPAQFHAQTLVARELLLSGHLKEAKELALQSYETAPWFGDTSMVLGRVAFDHKDYPEAEKRLLEAIRNSPEKSPIADYSRYYLASTYFSQKGKRHLVRETLLDLLNNPRGTCYLPAIQLHIQCYLAQNKWNDALRAATKAVKLNPENAELAELLKTVEKESRASSP